jgi:PAS domain-containing protein
MIYSHKIQPLKDMNDNERNTSAPLLCWDIFMSNYWKKMRLLEDAKSIYNLSKAFEWKHNWDFRKEILLNNKVVIVTSAEQIIVTVSSNISDMNGYGVNEIIGNRPYLFQGESTEAVSRHIIREAIGKLVPFETYITNYRKNGHPYKCHIQGYPVFNIRQKLSHFIAFEQAA